MKTEYSCREIRGQRLTQLEIIHSLKIYIYDNPYRAFVEVRKTELPNRKRARERWQESRISIVAPNGNVGLVEARQFASALQEACAIAGRWDASLETVGREQEE